MADTRSITITLKLDDGGDDKTTPTDPSVPKKSSDKDNTSKSATMFFIAQLGQEVLSELTAMGDYKVNNYMNLTDDYIGQRNLNIAQHYINGAISYANTTFNGVMTGLQVGGVTGAIVGGLIGALTASSRINRSNLEGLMSQNIELKQLDLQLQYTRRRAGWSTHAASIGEDL